MFFFCCWWCSFLFKELTFQITNSILGSSFKFYDFFSDNAWPSLSMIWISPNMSLIISCFTIFRLWSMGISNICTLLDAYRTAEVKNISKLSESEWCPTECTLCFTTTNTKFIIYYKHPHPHRDIILNYYMLYFKFLFFKIMA